MSDSRRTLKRALLVCAGAFVFCFSVVPLYRIACEKVFGSLIADEAADASKVGAYAVDETRWVEVQFDGGVQSARDWRFVPKTASMKVRPGQPMEALFTATNVSGAALVGNAVPSIAPKVASLYFNKTECFCFTEQKLEAGETRDMPVRFVVDPELPPDVHTVTLSYTFYLNEIATRRVATAAAPTAPAS